MNGKDITGVHKIVTNDLNVNGHIDMKGKKITGLGIGVRDDDAVNKSQLDAHGSYYWFTNQLSHNNQNTVRFPTINKHPYLNSQTSNNLRISLIGYYQIIYNDFYEKPGRFVIRNDATAKELFSISLASASSFTPISINAVIHIDYVVEPNTKMC